MNNQLPAPLVCGMCGALAGLFGGGFNQCLPVWIGAATGASVGCVICVCFCLFDVPQPPVAKIVRAMPTVIQNIYIIEPTGAPKITQANTRPANTESDGPPK
jgi:hypothetical protein